MPEKRAQTYQIVGAFLVALLTIGAIVYLFAEKTKSDILSYKEQAKEYTVIEARKIPEYTQLAAEQGAYQAVYEVGIRGGYNNRYVGRVDHLNVSYGAVNISTAIWADERVDKSIPTAVQNIILTIPEDKTIEGNLTEVIRNATLEYLRMRAPESGMDIGPYENATFMINRSECISDGYKDMGKGCFNVTIIPRNYTQKNDAANGSLIAKTEVTSTTHAHIEVRLFKMYELVRSFMRNNFLVKAGSGTSYNILAKQLEETTACPAGINCDWDVRTRTTEWCPTQNNCAYSADGQNAKLNYSCVPQVLAPACESTIQYNLKNRISEIENKLNTPEASPYTILCPSAIPNCEVSYNTGREIFKDPATSNSYKDERLNWTVQPASPQTWDDVIAWDGTNDGYDVLWWNQSTTGECRLPQGTVFLSDTISGKDTWIKSNFPEGAACADAYYANCHEIKRYKQTTGWGICWSGPDATAWCEMDAYRTRPGHTTACGASSSGDPYGGTWCSNAKTTIHRSDRYTCACPDGCDTEPGLWNVVQTAYTHCDIQYDFYGHFKYRAGIGPLLVTLTDGSRTIPVTDMLGQQKLEKPQLKGVYKGMVHEEPASGDGCMDREGDEDKTGDRYYHSADTGKDECPKARNPAAPRKDYYTAVPC